MKGIQVTKEFNTSEQLVDWEHFLRQQKIKCSIVENRNKFSLWREILDGDPKTIISYLPDNVIFFNKEFEEIIERI